MDYEVYHDESKTDGFWHGIFLVPVVQKHNLVDLLIQAREKARYHYPLTIKKIRRDGQIFNCAYSWIQTGVAALMARTKNQPYPLAFHGRNNKEEPSFISFNSVIGCKFILFRDRDNFTGMTNHTDYGSKVETTFRMGLKGGIHFLGNDFENIDIQRIHFDGHQHLLRHLDRSRIVGRLYGLRSYCSISEAQDVIDDRTGNHYKSGCQEYVDCQILQLTDLLVGGFRTIFTPQSQTKEIHRLLSKPLTEIATRYQQGYARMRNSRWRNSFCISQCYLESGEWKFEEIEYPKVQEGIQLLMNNQQSDADNQ
jgi:hypothetical protein